MLLIALIIICVGFLSGFNEQSGDVNDALGEENDDDEFSRLALQMIKYSYPVSFDKYKLNNAKDYIMEMAKYNLSPKCEEIRTELEDAIDKWDDMIYWQESNERDYESYKTDLVLYSMDMANEHLKNAEALLEEL